MPPEEFAQLSFVPLPRLQEANKDKYTSFDEVYGKDPNECDRPSLKKSPSADTDKAHKAILVNAKVRAVICCGECLKPRCIYSKAKLTLSEERAVSNLKSSKVYTCGCSLFPPSSKFCDTIVVKQDIECLDPVESQYFTATLIHFPPVCYWCGNPEETLLYDDEYYQLESEYETVRAICTFCKSEQKSPFTRHPLNAAKRKRKK